MITIRAGSAETLAGSRKDQPIWHLCTLIIPRRSITRRLVWGKVWRQRQRNRWIYIKRITEIIDGSNEAAWSGPAASGTERLQSISYNRLMGRKSIAEFPRELKSIKPANFK
jgi:hypothetical protein